MSNMGEKFREFLNRMEEEEKTRRDLILPLGSLRMKDDGKIESPDGELPLGETAFAQMCQTLGMPVDYVNRLFSDNRQDLVAHHFNHFLKQKADIEKMFRFKGNWVQGVVGKEYVPFDNYQLLQVFSDIQNEFPDVELKNDFTTDKRMNLRLVFPELTEDFGDDIRGKKDNLFLGFDLGNSEIGFRSISVTPIIWRLVCSNGMRRVIAKGDAFRQRHSRFDPSDLRRNLVTAIHESIEEGKNGLHRLQDARKEKLDDVFGTIERTGKQFGLSKKRIELVKDNFRHDPEHTVYGVLNSFTRTARDFKSHEARLELENQAGLLLVK